MRRRGSPIRTCSTILRQTKRLQVLAFPKDEVVGTLEWIGSRIDESGPVLARGTVEVPDGAEVALTITRVVNLERTHDGGWSYGGDADNPVDLAFLEALDPSCVHSLTLGHGNFVERSIRHVPHLAPGLRRLYIVWGGLSDAVLPHVAKLTGLTYLQTFGNQFSDAAVQQLAALQDLEMLYLEEETLTAAGLSFASGLPKLTRLGLDDVQATEDEIEQLRSAMPGVRVG